MLQTTMVMYSFQILIVIRLIANRNHNKKADAIKFQIDIYIQLICKSGGKLMTYFQLRSELSSRVVIYSILHFTQNVLYCLHV